MPPATEDAFVREVDEELRREQLGTVWKRYGTLIVGGILLALVALAGGLYWQSRVEAAREDRAIALAGALGDLGEGKEAKANAALATLAAGKDAGYAAAARLTQAGVALAKGDAKAATQGFEALAADTRAPQPMRDLALVRAVAAGFDTMPPQQAIDRLRPLATPGNPWFGSAGEMTAVAYLKLGRPKPAAALFAQLAKDKAVPDTLRARAVRISGMLGADAVPAAAATKG